MIMAMISYMPLSSTPTVIFVFAIRGSSVSILFQFGESEHQSKSNKQDRRRLHYVIIFGCARVDQHKNRLNHQKLENCEPERKAADFRLSTRPFLSLVEKKWLAFQLLLAVKQCHEKGICHGDIKCENVLVTSWNWLYLADFASFKPTYIPYDDPSDFSFFYDTRERRLCYLAPEVL
ncbi:unnamed protein product [Brassica napus]|uniref:(rape) hypothetical protein n=1 Tax=Brassica napus TaxID=3708 RepID=A0A816SBP0_BRANA|nr:unnamed protein product [Brassica napus]